VNKAALIWIINGHVGISSQTIWAVMMGIADDCNRAQFSVPWDSSDMLRCLALIEAVPEWESRLSEVSDRFPEWKGIVENWEELRALKDRGEGDALNRRVRQLVRS
jgi:hypothetical protein